MGGLNICLRIPKKAITLEGKACVTGLGCKSFDITLFQWGAAGDLDAGEALGAGDAGGYPAHQCFKTQDRQVYASSFKVKNHAEGNNWIKAATTHFNVRVFGKPFTSDKIPNGAITHPKPAESDDPAAGGEAALALGPTRISKNESDDDLRADPGAPHGAIALVLGEEGQMPCEWVWYTTDCFQHGVACSPSSPASTAARTWCSAARRG
ncbi:MAG: hypothetical protein U0359_08045 [Byssovorax sp.]